MRQLFLWFMVLLFGFAAGALVGQLMIPPSHPQPESIALNDLARLVKDGGITAITVQDDGAMATASDGQQYSLHLGQNDNLPGLLSNFGVTPDELAQVTYVVDEPPPFGAWLGMLASLLPVILFGAMLLLLAGQARGSNSQALSLGKSGARQFTASDKTITFQDVAGVEEAKQELREIVDFLRYLEKFSALGARVPKGVPAGWSPTMA